MDKLSERHYSPVAPPVARPAGSRHPLGPLLQRATPLSSRSTRLWGGVIFSGCLGVWAVAWWLSPAGSGLGTHQQLGLPPCALLQTVGIPCPTCGMTTAFSYTVRGRLLQALRAQPFAFVLALGTLLLAGMSADALIAAKRWQINWYRLYPIKGRVMAAIILLFLLAWIFKVVDHLASNPPAGILFGASP